MRNLAYIAAAGALGSLARYGLSGWVYERMGTAFPWGTLAVNVLGSFALGLLMRLGIDSDLVPAAVRVPVAVGFLGAFTTYSTFSYETLGYLEDGAWAPALANVAANLVLGLGAVWSGFVAARSILGGP